MSDRRGRSTAARQAGGVDPIGEAFGFEGGWQVERRPAKATAPAQRRAQDHLRYQGVVWARERTYALMPGWPCRCGCGRELRMDPHRRGPAPMFATRACYQRHWRAKGPLERRAAIQARCAAKPKPEPRADRTCVVCGVVFTPKPRGKLPEACSDTCSRRVWFQRQRKAQRARRPFLALARYPCAACGEPFDRPTDRAKHEKACAGAKVSAPTPVEALDPTPAEVAVLVLLDQPGTRVALFERARGLIARQTLQRAVRRIEARGWVHIVQRVPRQGRGSPSEVWARTDAGDVVCERHRPTRSAEPDRDDGAD